MYFRYKNERPKPKKLNLLIKEKNNIVEKINKETINDNEKINLFKNIIYLDEQIKEYDQKINESK